MGQEHGFPMAQGQSGRVEGSLAVGIQAGPALSASLSRARRQPLTGVSTQKRDGGDRKFLSISCFQSRILSSLGGSPVLSALHSLGPRRGLGGGPGGPAGTRTRAGPLSVAAPQLSLSTTP